MTKNNSQKKTSMEGQSEWPLVILVLLLGILATNLIC